ncbi:class I SAM-dependent methyltransferase [Intrasporangium oryzae]|uniref:class I SAM-dependent methyltransferase n=1 Tax=Intrasporangium oryzae TaxID=412687 RepID=UPI0004B752C8|nr:methyltransferase domain-containing protein [Intrasporangium oryzae]
MTFDVTPQAYDRFMGRYSRPLARVFTDWAGVREGQRVIDVGCGTGALTEQLVARVGTSAVSAVDPSLPFTTALRSRFPDLDVQTAAAEHLPYQADFFDVALAQLVVHFMTDPLAALREMARVTRPGGTVAACVWDMVEGGPLGLFYRAARDLDRGAPDERERPGTRQGHLEELCTRADLAHVEGGLAGRDGDARDLRGVVGAVHPRRRSGGRLRQVVAGRRAGGAARALPRAAPSCAVPGQRRGVECPGHRVRVRERHTARSG